MLNFTLADKMSLRKFIDENVNLLTIIGIFAAISAYFSSESDNEIYPIISFFSLIIFLVLCIELWRSFPRSEESSSMLDFFEILFQMFMLSVAFSILLTHEDVILMFFPLILWIIYSSIISILFNKFKLYETVRKIAENHGNLDPYIRSIVFYLMLGLALLFTLFSMKLINSILIEIR